ncbi:hypothetical protein Btru_034084 [Bulinus truncatus]|nr:hypothetical protein Btru_034084 [Bulinus truncatus]
MPAVGHRNQPHFYKIKKYIHIVRKTLSFLGLAAAVALGVTIAYFKKRWDSNPLRLKSFMLLGCFIQLAGVCGFVAYLVLGITKQDGLKVYGTDYYLTCVWCFMTWKWGLALLLYSRSFLHSYIERGRLLTEEPEYAKKAYITN